MPKLDATDEQTTAVGQLVVDNWGDNFQTGIVQADGCIILYAQTGPNHKIKRYEIDREGTVVVSG